MNNIKFYYRFKSIGIDYTSERDVIRHCEELNTFNDLENRFNDLKTAFDSESKERVDITINVLPDISGVTELLVYHNIKRKLFSKDIVKQCFSLCITKYEHPDNIHALYEYETTDFMEVKTIFRELITNLKIPNITTWKRML